MNEYIPADLRRKVQNRANGVCEYCRNQADFHGQSFSFEHIQPRAAGGETTFENLAFSCQGCNSHKAVKTTAEDSFTEKSVKLFNPRESVWREHFAWSDNFSEVIGTTPNGRATVIALKLNRQSLINLRQVLYAAGKHPPMK